MEDEMHSLRCGILWLAILVAIAPASGAGPIAYDVYGGNGGQNYGLLPDLSQGGTISWWSQGSFPYPESPSSQTAASHQSFDRDYSFEIRYYPSGAPETLDRNSEPGLPGLDVVAHVKGYLSIDPNASYADRVAGGFSATIRSVMVDPRASGTQLPDPLLALLAQPQRLHLVSPDSFGRPGYLPPITLTIDPAPPGPVSPLPVPEPPALALFATIPALVALRGRARWVDGSSYV
jgi:hypothetical protein